MYYNIILYMLINPFVEPKNVTVECGQDITLRCYSSAGESKFYSH